jgi:hypothetical protein
MYNNRRHLKTKAECYMWSDSAWPDWLHTSSVSETQGSSFCFTIINTNIRVLELHPSVRVEYKSLKFVRVRCL